MSEKRAHAVNALRYPPRQLTTGPLIIARLRLCTVDIRAHSSTLQIWQIHVHIIQLSFKHTINLWLPERVLMKPAHLTNARCMHVSLDILVLLKCRFVMCCKMHKCSQNVRKRKLHWIVRMRRSQAMSVKGSAFFDYCILCFWRFAAWTVV